MYRREFLKRAAAALAALAIVRPRKPVDHWYVAFIPPEDRTNIEKEYLEPALLSLERGGCLDPSHRNRILAAMRDSPKGEIWLNRKSFVRWGGRYIGEIQTEVFTVDTIQYA